MAGNAPRLADQLLADTLSSRHLGGTGTPGRIEYRATAAEGQGPPPVFQPIEGRPMNWAHLARHIAIAIGIIFLVAVVLVLVIHVLLSEL